MTALETAMQRLVTIAARLNRYNGENDACNVYKLFSTDTSTINILLRNGNQSAERPPKKETEMFWKGKRMPATMIRQC